MYNLTNGSRMNTKIWRNNFQCNWKYWK